MSEKNTQPRNVFAITERGDKSFWTKIGAAFTNKDGSVNLELDALPVSGRCQIRDAEEREEREERNDRRQRR
jgi:hypothetical protein